jgi:1-acyl-sn-glycerol-3-phosphate acyltransferase
MKIAIYAFLKFYCRIALRVFYLKWQIQELKPVAKGAVIFVANHQNAFLDAILVSCSTSRNPWFIARASVFKKKWVGYILSLLKMLPIYRFRDGFETLKNNEKALAKYVDLLKKEEAILIFGEGDQNDRWNLRAFQKGFARMAFLAAQHTTVNIVPVAIQYEAHSTSGSRVLVSFGEPIPVKKINLNQNTKPEYDQLINHVHHSVKSLMIHIDADQYEYQLTYLLKNRKRHDDLVGQLRLDQAILTTSGNQNQRITTAKKPSPIHPLYFYNYINHGLARITIYGICKWFVKDPQFNGSIKFAAGMILVPVTYVLQTVSVYLVSRSLIISIVYAASLPLSFLYLRRNTQI